MNWPPPLVGNFAQSWDQLEYLISKKMFAVGIIFQMGSLSFDVSKWLPAEQTDPFQATLGQCKTNLNSPI